MDVEDLSEEVTKLMRDVPPTHYSFKIRSFSLLSKSYIEKYESCIFEVGGYKWKLILYPAGDPSRDAEGHISLYLAFADTRSLPTGWEVNVTYRFTIFDQIRDRYLTIGDCGGRVRRFHGLRTKWGFSRLISLQTFTDPTSGYLVDDACEFGVEVFIAGNTAGGECLEMFVDPHTRNYSCKLENFSQLDNEAYSSETFRAGGYKWKIKVHPQGCDEEEENKSLSVFLHLAEPNLLPLDTKLCTFFKLRLRNQVHANHIECEDQYWFKREEKGWGWPWFICLDKLNDPKKGFLVDDTLIIEAEVTVLGFRKKDTR